MPTRDIHMKQIDFEREWLTLLQDYVSPLQAKVFVGYESQVRPLQTARVGAGAGAGSGAGDGAGSVAGDGGGGGDGAWLVSTCRLQDCQP